MHKCSFLSQKSGVAENLKLYGTVNVEEQIFVTPREGVRLKMINSEAGAYRCLGCGPCDW